MQGANNLSSTPHNPNLFPANFAGHLQYRGAIMDYVSNGTPLTNWDVGAILAYFTSNIDRHRNLTSISTRRASASTSSSAAVPQTASHL